MSDAVRFEIVDDTIGLITLDRPDNRNSMTPELLDAFAAASARARANDALRCVVVTGTGACFSAGADFKSVLQRDDGAWRAPHEKSFAMYGPFLSIFEQRVPVVGALNGHTVGGGFGLALCCDIRIGARAARYGANFTRLGLSPGMAISYLLPRLVGLARASELLYTGRLVEGDEAERLGILSSAVPAEEVLPRALELARAIAASAPFAVRETKRLIRRGLGFEPHAHAHVESYAQSQTLATDDAAEGIAALLEKREPKFQGR